MGGKWKWSCDWFEMLIADRKVDMHRETSFDACVASATDYFVGC